MKNFRASQKKYVSDSIINLYTKDRLREVESSYWDLDVEIMEVKNLFIKNEF